MLVIGNSGIRKKKIQIEFGAVLLFDDTKKTERQEQAI